AGAAREVLSDCGQLVNGRRVSEVLDKLSEWRKKRPALQGKKEFRLSEVTKSWLELFRDDDTLKLI
ncbi:MAG TPA: hypothetical protein VLH77_02240, partial [Gammaproteobacteria bacterium]|nr:hypothetical protein [Gammaproteobacteria bacterium]